MNDDELDIFLRTRLAFHNYSEFSAENVVLPLESAINSIPAEYFDFGETALRSHVQNLKQAVLVNSTFCKIMGDSISYFVDDELPETNFAEPMPLDYAKVCSTLRQLAREWSSDGLRERQESYGMIINALCELFPSHMRPQVRVLVPGCGLGRLPFDLSLAGFDAVGNELSVHMLYASCAILNSGLSENEITLHPYIHSPSHWRDRDDQLRAIIIPDISPSEIEQLGSMSMGIGDFYHLTDSATKLETFHAIATCFFIDAPFNFFKTLDIISDIVKPGGLWVNYGPLHWHCENTAIASSRPANDHISEPSIGLALSDVLSLIRSKGWNILIQKSGLPTTYCSTHPHRMGRMLFECEFWLARKDNY